MNALLGLLGSFELIKPLTPENKFNHQINYVGIWGRGWLGEIVWIKYQSGLDAECAPHWTM